jgi:hypothetical protein
MILRLLVRVTASLIPFLLLFLSAPWPAQAKKDSPRISSTTFEQALGSTFYFEDSDVLMTFDVHENKVYRSVNAGEDWKVIDEVVGTPVLNIYAHPWDPVRAYIVGREHTHWLTSDQGKTWRRFESEGKPHLLHPALAFHGRDPDKVIFQSRSCIGFECRDRAHYTLDGFDTLQTLRDDSLGCSWAVSHPTFGLDLASDIETRIFCLARGLFSPWAFENRMLVSDNFFKSEAQAMIGGSRSVSGVLNMAAVQKYLVAAAKAESTDEVALYVSHDSTHWQRAEFGAQNKVLDEAYTILESTNYSMQVNVVDSRGTNTLFTSNSNGTHFTKNIEHTNRGPRGYVDFEKITGIQGIVLVNIIDNWQDAESGGAEKQITSKISFDDARTFQDLKVGDESLHLHSATEPHNFGKIFSSPAPGIVMGVGNTGKMLLPYQKGDLYVSDNAGLTWRRALKGPHKYEIGDQGAVIVAIADADEMTKQVQYSLNHGKDWTAVDLDDSVKPEILTTVPDSTSLKFLFQAIKDEKFLVFVIDFDGLHERKCKEADFERWPARLDGDGKPSCIMGHKQFYRRRKADADCFVAQDFKDPVPETETCKCRKQDFECDVDFVRSEDGASCLPVTPIVPPAGECDNPDDTFTAYSGFRIIPGNDCEREGGEVLDGQIQMPCKNSEKAPASGGIASTKTSFDADSFTEWHYLERTASSSGNDETIILRTSQGSVWLSKDHGKIWEQILKDKRITVISPHRYFNDVVYFLTEGKTVYYSLERGDNMQSLEAPELPHSRMQTLHFHPDYKDVLLWTGPKESCVEDCGVTYYTENRHEWQLLLQAVKKCVFVEREGRASQKEDENMVFCEQYENENPSKPIRLLSSSDWFKKKTNVHFDDILSFATMSEFIVVAVKTEDRQSLKVGASVDGRIFAEAEFPPNFHVEREQAYTVLDSSTHAIFLHVTVSNIAEREYGSIIKSNSNGTSYSLSLNNVNRDTPGYVDFEKMQGLEGVAMVNVVANVEEVDAGRPKVVKSLITHNDGAQWAPIPPPANDGDDKLFSCVRKANVAAEQCSLHVHSYTERYDKGQTFSSSSAVGIMLAVGNVGDRLIPREEKDTYTFITRDGGITWTVVRQGSYLWEYGDQGSIIVICEQAKPTRVVHYTLDEGKTWAEFQFSDVDMEISQISTTPSDNSRNFLLWGQDQGGQKVAAVNIDFSGMDVRQRPCVLEESAPEADDYELWEPKHPLLNGNCLFGHVAQYHRKKVDRDCYNGFKTEGLHNIARNCTCTRQDFEW